MGRVHEIVVENFKSYQGRQQIGPFRHFTCIVGPNGSGKSNLMDAISFVLGVQAKVLRSEKLRDLVYRKEGENPKENERTGSVELTYVGDDSEAGAEGATLVFRRLILRSGEARFQVNDQTMSQADYNKTLESINILSKVRNFLVFQGDVESVAHRQGKDLTAFFEQISGSEAFKQEYDRLFSQKNKTEDNARYLFTKKRNAINEKKRVAQQKGEADDYKKLEGERRDLQAEFFLFRLHGIARQQEETEDAIARVEAERQHHHAELKVLADQLQAAERERAQAHLATTSAERAHAGARAKLDRLNPERVATQSRIVFLKKRLEDLQEHVAQDGKRKGKLEAQAQVLRGEEKKVEAEQQELAERLAQRELKFTPKQQEEFDIAQREAERITAQNGDRAREVEHQVRAVAAERSRAEHSVRELTALKDHLTLKVNEIQEAEAVSKKAVTRDGERSQACQAHLERIRNDASTKSEERDQVLDERRELMDTIQDITATEQQLMR